MDRSTGKLSYSSGLLIGFHVSLVTLPGLSGGGPGRRVEGYEAEYQRRGWRMFPAIDRVYVNARARRDLGWDPRYDFGRVIELLKSDAYPGSDLARVVGSKGYHGRQFSDGPYPVG